MAWSEYQEAIFDFVENGSGNAIIEAVAGSGKSTTIVECTKRLPKVKGSGNMTGLQAASAILLAFNKSIAEELKAKGVNARTFHSLTYSAVTKSRMVNNIETNKMRTVCKQNMGSDDDFMYSNFVCKLVGLAKQSGFGTPIIMETEQDWINLAIHHDLELENMNANFEDAIQHSMFMLEASNKSNLLDFDDLLYLAVRENLRLPQFDFVFVDECQDTNAIQRALIAMILKPGGRIIGVGDPAQAIYGFRGADSDSMHLLAEQFNCISLPLTVSYRCAVNVVKHARKWVSHIESAPGAPDGQVVNMQKHPLSRLIKDTAAQQPWAFGPNDLMVCRTTKPLVEFAYRCLAAKMPVKILGREIGQGLKGLISKLKANDVDDLEMKLEAWAMREIDKAIAKNLEAKAESIQDKADCILCLIHSLPEDDIADDKAESVEAVRTINALLNVIDQLFDTNVAAMTLATIHKSKGLEADRVWWLNSSQCPSKWAKKPWQKQQERNLQYVACTRAKTTLILVEDGSYRHQQQEVNSLNLHAPENNEQDEGIEGTVDQPRKGKTWKSRI